MSGTMLNELMELEPVSIVAEDLCGVVAAMSAEEIVSSHYKQSVSTGATEVDG